jgi:DDE family transposase
MTTIPEVAASLRDVLTTTAEAAAGATGFVRRRSKLTGAVFVQTVVFGWLARPLAGVQDLSRMAGALGVAISAQGLDQRFTAEAAACVQQVLAVAVQRLVTADPVAIPILNRFTGVYVQDSTTVALPADLATEWPGCGNATTPAEQSAGIKLQVRLDLRRGALAGPVPHPARIHDRAAPTIDPPLPVGALFLADLGYFRLGHLRALLEAGVFWLTRLQVQTAVFAEAGDRLDLLAWLARQLAQVGPGSTATVDTPVTLGASERLPARLLAVRVPAEVRETRRRKLHADARRRGQTVSQARLARADWTILVTNVPAARLTVRDALVIARARWQIELLFKLWKSHGHLAASRSAKPARRLTELFAKLLALLIQHWLLLVSCWRFPDRSLVRAAQVVRQFALALALASDAVAHLRTTIRRLVSALASGARIDHRRRQPSTWQLLLALDVALDDPLTADWAA